MRSGRRRQHHAADDLAGAQFVQRGVHLLERARARSARAAGRCASRVRAIRPSRTGCRHRSPASSWRPSGSSGVGIVTSPPNRPTTTTLPPLIRRFDRRASRSRRRTDEVDHRPGAAAGRRRICCDRVGRAAVDHQRRAGLLRRLALGRDRCRPRWRPWPPIFLVQASTPIRPTPPAPMITTGSSLQRRPTFFSAP